MTQQENKLNLAMLIAYHSDLEDEYLLNLREVVCIGDQWKRVVTL